MGKTAGEQTMKLENVAIVTVTSFESVVGIYAYTNKEIAEAKAIAMAKRYYTGEVDFEIIEDVYDHDKNDYEEQYGVSMDIVVLEGEVPC